MNPKLNDAARLINKIVCGENLSAKESEQVFTNIFLHDQDGFHFLALSVALHTKGETSDEFMGFCKTTERLGGKLELNVAPDLITDLAGTGGGKIKTVNVSTAASFIVAAAGFTVAKQAYHGITSPTGSADIFKTFGIDVFKLTAERVTFSLENIGICPYFFPVISPKLKNRGQLSKKIFVEKGVKIRTPFHLISFAYSPTKLRKRVYGCYSEQHLEVLGELFCKLGNERTLVFNGEGGLPEMSNIGRTHVVEQLGKKLKKYTLTPQDFGLKKAKPEEITAGGKEQNIVDFLRILSGKEQGAKRDIVLANASASLYVMGRVGSFNEGTKLALEAIDGGKAFDKLEDLVNELGSIKLLEQWKKQAEIL